MAVAGYFSCAIATVVSSPELLFNNCISQKGKDLISPLGLARDVPFRRISL
jgi:hypothetical protein